MEELKNGRRKRRRININNLVSRTWVDFLKLPTKICPIEGYQVCRVPMTIGKFYKVEVLCIVADIDECHILLGRPWRFKEKIVKAEVVDEHVEKVQDLQSYKQHDDKISTLLFGTRYKVADALSRKTTLLMSISNEVVGFDSITELYASDEDFHNTWMELKTKQHRSEFLLLDRIICLKVIVL
ncbi:hypothetical protein Tco_0728829 [Tanacetum coccineum]|uniref:DUF4283 domain-containing protein n=1 Tax=Tanacetum coccineum TaxID=301880 RepID=A0ABQ4YQD8_9ASTR